MAIFTKPVTKEVVVVDAISSRLQALRIVSPGSKIRLVMSTKTKESIKAEVCAPFRQSTVNTFKAADYFEGHPVDINDSLYFGEVLFTHEL